MGYNGSGAYTLPNPPFVVDTPVNPAPVNGNLSDIATALSSVLCTDGQSTMSGQLIHENGTAAAPAIAFASDATTGLYLIGAGEVGLSIAGTLQATFQASGWSGVTLTTPTIAGGAISGTFSGNATFSGNLTFSGTTTFSGTPTFSGTTGLGLPSGTTGQRPGSPANGEIRYNSSLNVTEFWNGTQWVTVGAVPTIQTFTSGTAATYTPTSAAVLWIKVRMCGGGGGGGASTAHNGTTGNTTSFGSWTAIGGAAGVVGSGTGAGGIGGTGGATGTGTQITRFAGGAGSAGQGNPATYLLGGNGGSNPFGGAGVGGLTSAAGTNAAANTGGGGGGAGNNGTTTNPGGGGGSGEYVEFIVAAPSTISYTVGAAANGGAAGTVAGGNGAAGIIIVEEYYT